MDRLHRPQLHTDMGGATRRKRPAPRHLWRRPRSAGSEQPDFSWTPDGERIAFIAQSPRPAVDIERSTALAAGPSSPAATWPTSVVTRRAIIAFLRNGTLIVRDSSAEPRRHRRPRRLAEQWSPDGRWIAYLTLSRTAPASDEEPSTSSRETGTQHHQLAMLHKPEILVWGSSPTQ